MRVVETVKGKIKEAAKAAAATAKVAADAVTGKAATVELEIKGKFAAGQMIEAILTVTSTGGAIESKGAYVELYGEDDVKEGLLEKAREIVLRQMDPTYKFEIQGPFKLEPGEKKIIAGNFTVPADLDPARKWLVRGRIQAFGNDPDSPFRLMI